MRDAMSSARRGAGRSTSRLICLASWPVLKGRISGPWGSPGRERTIPLLSSTRSASRIVDRLAPNCATSSRSLGSRSPGLDLAPGHAASICSTTRW